MGKYLTIYGVDSEDGRDLFISEKKARDVYYELMEQYLEDAGAFEKYEVYDFSEAEIAERSRDYMDAVWQEYECEGLYCERLEFYSDSVLLEDEPDDQRTDTQDHTGLHSIVDARGTSSETPLL